MESTVRYDVNPGEEKILSTDNEFDHVKIYDFGVHVVLVFSPTIVKTKEVRVSNRSGLRKVRVIFSDKTKTVSVFDPTWVRPARGVVATHGGVAAGPGGIAIRGDVYGGINVPNKPDKQPVQETTGEQDQQEVIIYVYVHRDAVVETHDLDGGLQIRVLN